MSLNKWPEVPKPIERRDAETRRKTTQSNRVERPRCSPAMGFLRVLLLCVSASLRSISSSLVANCENHLTRRYTWIPVGSAAVSWPSS
jgi:hypothetical protein